MGHSVDIIEILARMESALTILDLAHLLGYSDTALQEAAASGALPTSRIGGMIHISPAEATAWMSARHVAPVQPLDPEGPQVARKPSIPSGDRIPVSPPPTHLAFRSRVGLAQEFPLLSELAANSGLEILSIYRKSDLTELFKSSEKTIRRWTDAGQLPNRRLPNRGRCLAGDIERFLARMDDEQLSEDCE